MIEPAPKSLNFDTEDFLDWRGLAPERALTLDSTLPYAGRRNTLAPWIEVIFNSPYPTLRQYFSLSEADWGRVALKVLREDFPAEFVSSSLGHVRAETMEELLSALCSDYLATMMKLNSEDQRHKSTESTDGLKKKQPRAIMASVRGMLAPTQ